MKKSTWAIIPTSFIIQYALAYWNMEMTFLDASYTLAEAAVLFGLILLAHGIGLWTYIKRPKWSLVLIVCGYMVASMVFFVQSLFSDWYVTGMGGVGPVQAIGVMMWPAVTSLTTIVILERRRRSGNFRFLQSWVRHFLLLWGLLAIPMAMMMAVEQSAKLDVLDIFLGPLFIAFLSSFGVGAVVVGSVAYVGLSLHFSNLQKERS